MDIQQLQTITHNFLKELEDGKQGKKTSLAFIRHNFTPKAHVPEGELFQILRIGGSIYQKAMVKSVKGKVRILSRLQQPLPVFDSEKIFLDFIEKNLDPKIRFLALNFAYPMKPKTRDGLLDGVLMAGTKEHSFGSLVGKPVGETVENYVMKKTGRSIWATLANDTVCLLLSGLTKFSWDELVGGVIGTGLNFAMFLDEHTLVNLESARFNTFTQTPEGERIDRSSAKPGSNVFEKEVAGGYLYQHFNLKIKELGIKHRPLTSTKELDVVANQNGSPASLVAQEISQRSAALVACQIAGITLFHRRDCTFVIEGSLFWRGWRYKDHVALWCRRLAPDYQVTFVFIDNSGILGAAKLLS